MPSLNAEVDAEQFVSRHFGRMSPQRLRQSEARRGRLERWARVVGHDGVSLSLNPTSGETARVTFDGDSPDIEIPSWEIPQPVTDIQREAYDFLMQRTMTLHEVGHVNYTDQDALEMAVSAVDPGRAEQFHTIWNALEDGAIEAQLRGEFSVRDEIAVMNANYMGSHGRSKTYGVMDAALRACLDLAVYDTGDLRTLLDDTDSRLSFEDEQIRETFEDDVLPEIRSAIPDIVTESDPADRTERILGLWNEIEPYIESDDESTLDDIDAKGDHATQDSGSGSPADRLDDIDPRSVDDRVDSVLGGDSDTDSGQSNSQSPGDANRDRGDDTAGDQLDQTVGGDATSDRSDDDSGNTHDDTTPDRSSDQPRRDRDDSGGNQPDSQPGDHPDESGNGRSDDRSDPAASNDTDDPTQAPESTGAESAPDGDDSAEAASDGTSGGTGDAGSDRSDDDQQTAGDRNDERGQAAPSQVSSQDRDAVSSEDDSARQHGGRSGSQPSVTGDDDPEGRSGSGSSSGLPESDIDQGPNLDSALEDSYLERVADEQSQRRDDLETLEAEVDACARALDRIDDRNQTPTELDVPTGGDVRRGAWADTRRQGTRLRQILEDSLRQEQRSSWRRGRPSGRIDARSLPRIARSDPRVFRQRVSPDEKDYSAVLVLDRSGSMSGEITHAEEATVALGYALEEIDVETSVIDMCHSRPRLAKPYGRRVEPSLDSLLTGETGGETPLSEAVRLARERVRDRDGTPFCIVITDGQPDDQDEYIEELRKASFPVLGVYLAFEKSGPDSVSRSVRESANLFDQRRIVTDESRLVASLRGLCREVMF